MIAFTAEELAALKENEFEDCSSDTGRSYAVKTRVHVKPCGCCEDVERVTILKNEDGTFDVMFTPAGYGSDEFMDCETLAEALDAF